MSASAARADPLPSGHGDHGGLRGLSPARGSCGSMRRFLTAAASAMAHSVRPRARVAASTIPSAAHGTAAASAAAATAGTSPAHTTTAGSTSQSTAHMASSSRFHSIGSSATQSVTAMPMVASAAAAAAAAATGAAADAAKPYGGTPGGANNTITFTDCTPQQSKRCKEIVDLTLESQLVAGQSCIDGDQQHQKEKYGAQNLFLHYFILDPVEPFVKFMLEALEKAGCPVDKEKFFVCAQCPLNGAYDAETHEVVICENHIGGVWNAKYVITHELIHAFDNCRAKVDFTNARHLACTEIRASSLSGDCFFTNEFFNRLQFKFVKQHQACVKRRATMSVSVVMGMPKEEAAKIVDEVWEPCFGDTAPFNHII